MRANRVVSAIVLALLSGLAASVEAQGAPSAPKSTVVLDGDLSSPQCKTTGKRQKSQAGDFRFDGRVTSWSGAPIGHAQVKLWLGDRSAVTSIMFADLPAVVTEADASGVFHVELPRSTHESDGEYQRLEVSAPGYFRVFGPTVAGGSYCVNVILVSGSNEKK